MNFTEKISRKNEKVYAYLESPQGYEEKIMSSINRGLKGDALASSLQKFIGDVAPGKVPEYDLQYLMNNDSKALRKLNKVMKKTQTREVLSSSPPSQLQSLRYLIAVLELKYPPSVEGIKKAHKTLTEGLTSLDKGGLDKPINPGLFRDYEAITGTERVFRIPTEEDLHHILSILSDDQVKPSSIAEYALVAAYLGYRIYALHPFCDANTRTAKLVMNCVLQHYKFPVFVNINGDNIRTADHKNKGKPAIDILWVLLMKAAATTVEAEEKV